MTLFQPGQAPRSLEFFCACVPPKTTSQQKRAMRTATGIRFFKGKDQEAAISTLEGVLLPHQPEEPLHGLIRLEVGATWPWRASDLSTKAKKQLAESLGHAPCGVKPDLDNFVKQLQDCLVALRFIERDELVCDLRVQKFLGEAPGIWIRITEVGGF